MDGGRHRLARRRRLRRWLLSIAPEMVAGASDNDPTNVGTAVVVGAQSAYRLAWVALLVAPLLAVVLTIAARLGSVTGSDLQSLTRRRYGWRVAAILLASVVAVNVVTIAADIQAGAAGIGLLAGLDPRWIVVPLAGALAALLLIGRYDQVEAVLRYLLLGFLAFTAAAIVARPDWAAVLRASLVPVLSLREGGLAGALALLGTTLTSYVYVWETIQRGAEKPAEPAAGSRAEGSLVGGGRAGGGTAARVRAGAIASAVFTAAILWSMLVASAATLGRRHQVPVSAQDAARALRPLAGPVAADLFAAGLVISAVVALPVLMTSTAYVVGAQFDWRRGLSQPVGQARRCYAILGASVGLGVLVTLAGVPVFGMLVAASVIGGFGTPVGLVLLVRLARDRQVMGDAVISRPLALAGWMIAVVVGGLGLLCVVGAAAGRL